MTDSSLDSHQLQLIDSFESEPIVAQQPQLLCVVKSECVPSLQSVLRAMTIELQIYTWEQIDEAITQLRQTPLDYLLISGEWLADWQKLAPAIAAKLPVIVLLTDAEDPSLDECLRLGVADYLEANTLTPSDLKRAFFHVAKQQSYQQQNSRLHQTLQRIDERYRLTLDVSKDGIWDWTISQSEIESNRRLREMLGLTDVQIPLNFEQFKSRIHPQDYQDTKAAFKDHLHRHEEFSIEVRLRHEAGGYRDFWLRGQVQRSSLQSQPRMCGLMTDITERKRRDRRNRFLSQASSLLNASLDSQTTLENLAWLAVPRVADWCILDVFVEETGDHRTVVSHRDRDQEYSAREFYGVLAQDSQILQGPQYSYQLDPEKKQKLTTEQGWSASLMEQLNLQAYIWIPLQVGSRLLGFIFFAWSEEGRCCTAEDLSLLQELAYRATWSIENTRLYDERQAAYKDLQGAIAQLTTEQKRLQTLQHLTTLINRRLTNIPELLAGLVQQICKDMPAAQVCSIALYDPLQDNDFFVVTDGVHQQAIALGELLQQDKSWLREVYETGQPKIRDFDAHAPMPCSMAAVAIESVSSGRLGVLLIGNWQIAQAFSLEECEFLSAVGEEAAIAIDNARLIKTLEQQNQELLETSRVKDLFLATVSHELRTPMNAILGFSQVLLRQRQSSLGSSEKQMLNRILSNGRSLMALINDILDFSQMKLTALQLLPSTFDVVALNQAIVAELQSLADQKRLLLRLENQLHQPTITHDQKRLRQVIVNLVANALSFTQHGTVTIFLREQAETDTITITVEDTGIGIAPENLDNIFNEFWQVHQDIHRAKSGTGLGLAISYNLVQRMEGAIAVESTLGKGSRFTVTLPRTLSPKAIAPADTIA